ncbi:hypothetical protein H2200_011032 [Cladophialophora chaetospira]|uniref:Cytochrome b2, mitochondrial n=1 Tax=Cladophialophora chaetospira TaxID=386627 RepID=A0AA38WZX6_9EURO|nr:hypothetical protein H2200_011032 [Cladophialophora chaetospira]
MTIRKIGAAELSQHCSDDDAWIAINGLVWDVSGFATIHPGGRSAIVEHYGRDGSEVYNDLHSRGLMEAQLGKGKQLGVLKAEESELSHTKTEANSVVSLANLDSIVSIHEFEKAAQKILKPKSAAYISSATEASLTKQANADWYQRIWFRPRILTGVGTVDTGTTILGKRYASPIFNAPTSSAMLAHRDGELAMARGLARRGNTIIIPTMSSYPLNEIVEALPKGHPFFFQLYVHSNQSELEKLLQALSELGPQAIVVTADLPVMTKRETYEQYLVKESGGRLKISADTLVALEPVYSAVDPDLTWAKVKWIQERTRTPVFVKGIQCAEDAQKAVAYGCSGIYISNHGGRALDTAQPAILTLLEIQACCPEVLDKLEVLIDGGVQRGTDILKAICLGASAVCLGRPLLYSLAYGEKGVEHAIKILEAELRTAMQLVGITSLQQAHPGLLNTRQVDSFVQRGNEHPWARKVRRVKL